MTTSFGIIPELLFDTMSIYPLVSIPLNFHAYDIFTVICDRPVAVLLATIPSQHPFSFTNKHPSLTQLKHLSFAAMLQSLQQNTALCIIFINDIIL